MTTFLHRLYKVFISFIRCNRSNQRSEAGFTVVELLVAMSLFVVVIGISSGVFIQSMRTQRTVVALNAAVSNAQLTIEQISREMRTGQNFSLVGGGLSFTNAKGEEVVYKLNSDVLEKEVDGESRPLTAENVSIKNLNFVLKEDSDYPFKITVIMQVGIKEAHVEGIMVNLQTTISARI